MRNLELIVWMDSHGCSPAWGTLDEGRQRTVLRCESVGYVIHENDELIIVAPHRTLPHPSCEQQFCGDMTIPKVAVIRRIELITLTQRESKSLEKIGFPHDGEEYLDYPRSS